MQVTVQINERDALEGEWFLFCDNKTIPLCEETNSFQLPKAGEYELTLFNNFQKGIIKYILLWIVNILIAPFNILLMNTESDWYNQIIPSSANYKFKCTLKKDANIHFSIRCRNFKQFVSGAYSIKASADCDIIELFYYEDCDNNTFKWELNKYISKFISTEIWIFGIICITCFFSNYSYPWSLILVFSVLFLFIMIGTIAYTIFKAQKIKTVLKNRNSKNFLR